MDPRKQYPSPNTSVEDKDQERQQPQVQSNNSSPSSEDSAAINRALEYRLGLILRDRIREPNHVLLSKVRLATISQLKDIEELQESIRKGKRTKSAEKEDKEEKK